MELLEKLELFSRTTENQFVFSLFDLLLCGVIVLVILRGWRSQTESFARKNQFFLFLAFTCLGASFGLGAAYAGFFLFLEIRLPELSFDLLAHAFQAGAWLLLAASAHLRPTRGSGALRIGASVPLLLLAPLWLQATSLVPQLALKATGVLDLVNLLLAALTFVLFYRHPLGGRNLATGALAALFLAAFFHLSSSRASDPGASVVFWNLEQLALSLALFSLALAIGETSEDLFNKVFVRLQIAFILLASVMILAITQTEKTEYLASLRSRSNQLAEFVRAHVDYFRRQNQPLPQLVGREDFLQRLTLGFGNLPELKIVRIISDRQVARFEIADNGAIQRAIETRLQRESMLPPDPDEYFVIHALPLTTAGPGKVEFYGTQEFLHRHSRKRILLIFSLFTGMVALSTLMIGLVVRGASATIGQQEREIEETQRRLLQASRLAAIGELAAGVAHEVNNPATTILSRASFLLSQQSGDNSSSDREDLEAIVSQAQRIAQVTRGLLVFSRPQALEIRATPIETVVATSLHSVENLLAANRIGVEKDLPLDLPRVLVDDHSFARALENVFRNAIDAMPGGGTLGIHATKDDPSGTVLRLEISDTGMGIERGNLTRIFDPFFTTKEVGKGTGLGLSIVHGIIKEHHGTIFVKSQPGVGTTFTIVLPTEQ